MPILLSGKEPSKKIRLSVASGAQRFESRTGKKAGLAVLLVGDNPSSMVYVRMKERACREVGMASFQFNLPADSTQEMVLEKIESLNRDERVHGILLQLPLPPHLAPTQLIRGISPEKDVDGFHPINLGGLLTGTPLFYPCTPLGIVTLLHYYGIDIPGMDICIVGRSLIVGRPLALIFANLNGTVTLCHTKTRGLEEKMRRADILAIAAGRPGFVSPSMVKKDAVVVDVGVNRLEDGRIVGDVRFEEVFRKAGAITPVPGGVGPMTISLLLNNTLKSAFRKEGLGFPPVDLIPEGLL